MALSLVDDFDDRTAGGVVAFENQLMIRSAEKNPDLSDSFLDAARNRLRR